MTDSHRRSSAAKVAPRYFLWKVAHKPVSAWLSVDMVDRLAQEVTEAVRSLRARGSEIGGLLLGRVSAGPAPRVTVIEYQLVPCDHARGPLYWLAVPDVERFERAIQVQAKAENGLQVVGYFRSHTRPGLSLKADEVDFCKAKFGEPYQIAMLVRPQRAKPSTAGIFIWEDGEMRAEASYLEFPTAKAALLPRCPAEQPEPVAMAEAVMEKPAVFLPPTPSVETARGKLEEPRPKPQLGTEPVPVPAATLAPIIHIASRRKVAPFPAPVGEPAVEVHGVAEPEVRNPGKPARVGRCSVKVELRPVAARAEEPSQAPRR